MIGISQRLWPKTMSERIVAKSITARIDFQSAIRGRFERFLRPRPRLVSVKARLCSPPANEALSRGLEFQLVQLQFGRAPGQMEDFNTDNLIALIKVQHYPGRHFLRFDDLGIIQSQVERVGFLVHVQFHSLPFIVRSKNTLTTRTGSTVVLTTTRNTRFPNSGIRR